MSPTEVELQQVAGVETQATLGEEEGKVTKDVLWPKGQHADWLDFDDDLTSLDDFVAYTLEELEDGDCATPRCEEDNSIMLPAFEGFDKNGRWVESGTGLHTDRNVGKKMFALLLCVLYASAVFVLLLSGFMASKLLEVVHGGYDTAMGMVSATLILSVLPVLLVPSQPLVLMVGFLYGAGVGGFIAVIGTLLGNITAFLFGRYCCREYAQQYAAARPKLAAALVVCVRHNVVIPALLRCTVLTNGLVSYTLAASRMGAVNFVVSTFVGSTPAHVLVVLIGSLGSSPVETAIVTEATSLTTKLTLTVCVLALLVGEVGASLLSAWLLVRYSKMVLREQGSDRGQHEVISGYDIVMMAEEVDAVQCNVLPVASFPSPQRMEVATLEYDPQ